MSTVLVVGIILIALLVGVSVLQWLIRRRQARVERKLPHVAEMASLGLQLSEFPAGYRVHYRGPVTNERLARESEDEEDALDEIDEQGRVIGYRQAFRDPRSYGEVVDVLLNLTLRRKLQQRLLLADITLFEDANGAAEAINEPPPTPDESGAGESGMTVRVAEMDGHGLAFAHSVRQWSRLNAQGDELQRKLEVRWQSGRIGCVVAGDSEPPGGINPADVWRVARTIHERV
ncbi:MAG: hypothetical protein V3V06_05385, partial [Dehalococcoidia bacterium]